MADQYSTGCLIGNHVEDGYGAQLASGNSVVTHGQESQYTTVMKGSYTTGMMEGIDQYRVNQVQPEVNKGVPKDILFEHNGAPNKEELYNTSYTATMNPNVTVPQRTSLRDQKQKQWDAEKAACSRNNKPYESTTASEYVEDNSCIVQPADKTHLFKGELTRTFESPHRKLRLRTN